MLLTIFEIIQVCCHFKSRLIWLVGNILMISEGWPGVHDFYTLKDGTCEA